LTTPRSEPTGTLEVALAHAVRLLAPRPDLAEAQAREILAVAPSSAEAWGLLAEARLRQGDEAGAGEAYAGQIAASVHDPELQEAAEALAGNQLAIAERLLKPFLKRHPDNVAALRMLAEVAGRIGRYDDSEVLLARCLELAPGFAPARHNHALVLYRQNRPAAAIEEIDRLLASDPGHPAYRSLRAAALAQIGEYEAAIGGYQSVLADHPVQPKGWMSLGHALKTVGRTEDSIGAYRRSLQLQPSLGESWWSLANLKTFRFTPADIEAIRAQLARADLGEDDRLHLHFALGKALEDAGDWAGSFENYQRGNALRRPRLAYDADETTAHVGRAEALFTPAFFAERAGSGSPAPDPIFVVGLPRSGSTLVEQILASHSKVEGTMELPDISSIARRLGGERRAGDEPAYPGVLAELPPEQLRSLGEEYLERTRIQRKTGRPLFIDKMPNNFAHLGLIHLILPNAKVVDVRRHPLACCFSGFKQHFARGQGFTYDLEDIGRYYADYVRLMAHVDTVLPGRVHRVIYEDLVEDPEPVIRRLLDYCGLEFEPACLSFHQTLRPVRTASSEQVRQPLNREGLDQWRNYEPWLGPLKHALGDTLQSWRAPLP
jgi:cytochrome c-type biogenesis protein CcmH/NrfG